MSEEMNQDSGLSVKCKYAYIYNDLKNAQIHTSLHNSIHIYTIYVCTVHLRR